MRNFIFLVYYYNDVNIYMYIYKIFYDIKVSIEFFRGICVFGGETKKGRRGKIEIRIVFKGVIVKK